MSDTAERRSQQVVKVKLTDTACGAQIVLAYLERWHTHARVQPRCTDLEP